MGPIFIAPHGGFVDTSPRTSLPDIVSAGRAVLESSGVQGLTMQAVAERVGVRAPSLYKMVRDREQLVALVIDDVVGDLTRCLDASLEGSDGDPRGDLVRLTRAARRFAHGQPTGFRLIFAPGAETRLAASSLTRAVRGVMQVTGRLAGEARALDAARPVTACLYGFVSMELAGAFQLGGDVGDAFEFGLERLVDALAARA